MIYQSNYKIKLNEMSKRKYTSLDDLMEETFINCNAQVLAHYKYIQNEYNEEVLHKMRIALRMFRSFIDFFKKEMPKKEFLKINKIIKDLIKPTSKARDFDVFSETYISPAFSKNRDSDEFKQLYESTKKEEENLHKYVINYLSTPRYKNNIEALSKWIMDKNWKPEKSVKKYSKNKALKKFIEKKLIKRHKKIMQSKREALTYSRKELHKLRVDAKELRYIVETLGFCMKNRKQEIALLRNIQNVLGKINDTYVAEKIIHDLSPNNDNNTSKSYIEFQAQNQRDEYFNQLKAIS